MSEPLSGAVAAKLADAVYDIQTARTESEALTDAGESPKLAKLSSEARLDKAVMGKSGAVRRAQTGFGLVMDRGAGRAGEKVIVFRGTNFGSMADWGTNFQTGMMPGPGGIPVHAGFWKLYKQLQPKILAQVAPGQPVHCVGHSLGGALATLAAVDMAERKISSRLYTFGCPRVGGSGLNAAINRHFDSERVFNVYAFNDPVPMVPVWPYFPAEKGAIAISGAGNIISSAAHSMKDSYIPAMPESKWPQSRAVTGITSVDSFLDMAEKNDSTLSGWGYFCLSMAMKGMLKTLSGLLVQPFIGAPLTLMDDLSILLERAVHAVAALGERILRWVRIALKLAGLGVMVAGLTMQDLTARFLRFVLDRVLQPVMTAATVAIRQFI
jgi:hypothetical protein